MTGDGADGVQVCLMFTCCIVLVSAAIFHCVINDVIYGTSHASIVLSAERAAITGQCRRDALL